MIIEVWFGISNNWHNVTDDAFHQCYDRTRRTLLIPVGDEVRSNMFGDPMFGTLKSVRITSQQGFEKFIQADTEYVLEDVDLEVSEHFKAEIEAEKLLDQLHSELKLKEGSFRDEFAEQRMAVIYLRPNDIVLEIGGNIGRNSCVIGKLLSDSSNLVVVECDPKSIVSLKENRNLNNLNFHIELSAISKVPLKQNKWNSFPMEENEILEPGWFKVNTITWPSLRQKYNLKFNTLILDCEGAFYYILKDAPDILDNIRLIIIENDFFDEVMKNSVLNTFIRCGFELAYNRSYGYTFDFYQVWQR